MDNYDKNILRHLQEYGCMSTLLLAERIHLSAPQTLRRVASLEQPGVIRSYVTQVSAASRPSPAS